MKYIRFFAKAGLLMVCTCWVPVSCEKSQELTVSPDSLVIGAFPEEQPTIGISTGVSWTATVKPGVDWLELNPTYGEGNATVTLTVSENSGFSIRTAWIAIAGEGVKTDTVKVVQEPGVNVAEKIDDENFRKFCLDNYDKSPKDGKLNLPEVQAVTIMDISKMGIESLAGIEYFAKLEQLKCNDNKLGHLDLSKNKEITRLDCSYNELTVLNVSENIKLSDLDCTGNQLTGIDVTKNSTLMYLFCSINKITSIDVSNNTALTILMCADNQLTSLDVSKNTKLGRFSCDNNKLSNLDVRHNTLITQLWCGSNLFTTLNLSQNTALQSLICTSSLITSLDLYNNTALTDLSCSASRLTSLDLSRNTLLTNLTCAGTGLKGTIDISLNTKLIKFDLDNETLEIIHVWKGFNVSNDNYKKNQKTIYTGQ
jgi:hypothetical protein